MVVRRLAGLGRGRADGDDRIDHQVAGHDVQHRVRRGRELRQLAAAVRQDQRLGHLEALDPARVGMQPGRLDDGRPDDRDGDLGPHLDHDPLPQRLGEGIDVGPAERPGAFGAGLDQLGLHPFQPAPLGVGGGGQISGLPVLPLGLLAQRGQPFRRTGLGLEQVAHPQTGLGLHPVVDGVLVRGLRDRSAAAAGGVRGGDVHVVRDLGPGACRRRSTASSIRCIRFWVPTTLVVKAWSIGGSKDTSPAQCTTMSRSAGSAGTFGRSPSITSIRLSSSASAPRPRLAPR